MSARPAPIRLGMVGGGEGAFIGAVHRIAARLDDRYRLLAGALSASPEKALRSGEAIGLDRAYPDVATMLRAEAARPDGIEAVAIVTPNHLHVPVAIAALEAGLHVICDKPVATSLAEARRLAEVVRRTGKVFALTHTYTGYPMIRRRASSSPPARSARSAWCRSRTRRTGSRPPLEASGQKQAEWRTDPARAGAGGALGDIGTHAFQLAGFVTGLSCDAVAAELTSFVPAAASTTTPM